MKQIFILLIALASLAVAGPYPYTHDGFFLNFALGFGYQGLDYEYDDDDDDTHYEAEASGVAFDLSYRIGGRIAPFTVLHATVLRITNLTELEGEITENGKTESFSTSDYSASMFLYGIGVTYFLPPYNYYVSGSVGLSLFTLEDEDNEINAASSFGLGFQILAGKEWWLSENWGAGVAVAMTYGSADDKDGTGELSAFAINFFITVTYN